jgi:chromosome segregation ATPase
MTQITQEKGELQREEAGESPLVQPAAKIVKKRSLSKQVEHKTAEMCDAIGKRWEQELGSLMEILGQYKAKAMEYEDKIEDVSSELADLDTLIKECEDKVTNFDSNLAERQSLIMEQEDMIKELEDYLDDKHERIALQEENIRDLQSELSDKREQIEECENSTEEDSRKLDELNSWVERLDDLIEYNEELLEELEREAFDMVDQKSEHRDCIKGIRSGLAQSGLRIGECKAKLEQYKYEKSMQDEHKKELQECKNFFEQKQKEIGDRLTNRELEIGEEIREAYTLAKEEVERSAI